MLYFATIVIALAATVISGSCLTCEDESACTKLLKDLEKALLQDETNLSQMRRAFFHSPTATPVLLRVVYNVTYSKNVTMAVAANDVPQCSRSIVNTTIDLNQRNITYGWTSSGVYTVFHPTVLTMMQAHTPFAVLRIVQQTLGQRGPETDTFLWDGSYELPTLQLNMHINSLSCTPSNNIFESALMDLNTLLKVHAGNQDVLNFMQDNTAIGFTLSSASVSTNIDPFGSGVTIIILYSVTSCVLYAISVCLFPCWCFLLTEKRRKHKNKIKPILENNRELIGGMLITSIIAIAFEFCARIVHCAVWTIHRENILGNALGVWLPQLFFYLFATFVNSCGHICICCSRIFASWLRNYAQPFMLNHPGVDNQLSRPNYCFVFTSKVNVILPIHLTIFGLVYCFFPAIILTFVYPTRMIAIFTFVLAYFFATTVIFAVMIKLYGWFLLGINKITKCSIFITLFVIVSLVIMYIYAITLVFIYALIIGRGSVVNTTPLFIISLFPSIILSLGAWVAKRIILNGSRNMCSCKNEVAENDSTQKETATTSGPT